jgi:hypothetical protein
LQAAAVLWVAEIFWVVEVIQVGVVIWACGAGGMAPTMEPNTIPFGGEATSSFFHRPFVPTKPPPQSDAFSVQDPIPTRNTKEHQGNAKRLVLSKHGKWVDKALGNQIICIAFNISLSGCRRPSCNFSHSCSLCGGLSHGSDKCNT